MGWISGLILIVAAFTGGEQMLEWFKTGVWHSRTLGGELQVPANYVFSDWIIPQKFMHWVVFDAELALLLLIVGGVIVIVIEKMADSQRRHYKRSE